MSREGATEDGSQVLDPFQLAGDKGCRANWVDEYLLSRGITPVIPSKSNGNREERGIDFDRSAYRERNIIERLIGWLKESRRVFTRYEKAARNFLGMLKLTFIRRYLRLICR